MSALWAALDALPGAQWAALAAQKGRQTVNDGTYQGVVMRNMALEGEVATERERNRRLRRALTAVLDVGFVIHTEDGLFCNYCQISTEYPNETGDYADVVLEHRADCVYVIATGVLEELERAAEAERRGDDGR